MVAPGSPRNRRLRGVDQATMTCRYTAMKNAGIARIFYMLSALTQRPAFSNPGVNPSPRNVWTVERAVAASKSDTRTLNNPASFTTFTLLTLLDIWVARAFALSSE